MHYNKIGRKVSRVFTLSAYVRALGNLSVYILFFFV